MVFVPSDRDRLKTTFNYASSLNAPGWSLSLTDA